jgi:hypothetical protein
VQTNLTPPTKGVESYDRYPTHVVPVLDRLGEERDGGTGPEQEDLDDLAEGFAEDVTYKASPRNV